MMVKVGNDRIGRRIFLTTTLTKSGFCLMCTRRDHSSCDAGHDDADEGSS